MSEKTKRIENEIRQLFAERSWRTAKITKPNDIHSREIKCIDAFINRLVNDLLYVISQEEKNSFLARVIDRCD